MLLFVYGTLKNGFSRQGALSGQRYLGTAQTKQNYGMFTHGGYPAMVDEKLAEQSNVQATKSLYGELYEVDEICLQNLDKIEGVDFDLFERKIVELEYLHLMRLPIFQNTFNLLEKKQAQAYFFKRSVTGCADCGSFWSRRT